MLAGIHREDVKAAIRKRFGSARRFERAHGLPKNSVSDLLRGKRSKRVEDAINSALGKDAAPFSQSDMSDDSSSRRPAHRINRKAA